MENNALQSPPPEPAADLTAHQALFLIRGMSRVFWGLFFGLTLFFGQASIYIFDNGIRIPAHVIGSGLILWGLRTLRRAEPLSRAGAFLLQICSLSAFLLVYFSPFVNWWLESPDVPWFAGNFIGFVVMAILLLLFMNLFCADVAGMLGVVGFRLEAFLSALSVLVLLLVPFFVLLGFSLAAANSYGSTFAVEFNDMIRRVPYQLYFLFIGPFALALMVVWKARELCDIAFKAGAAAAKTEEPVSGE